MGRNEEVSVQFASEMLPITVSADRNRKKMLEYIHENQKAEEKEQGKMKKLDFNRGWTCRHLDGEGPGRPVTIPHDAMISEKRTEDSAGGINTGWFEGDDYLYEKEFDVPEEYREMEVTLEFEGVYHNAEVYLNGEKAAFRPYGYTNFYVDASDYLKYGGLPMRLALPDEHSVRTYLEDVYDSVVMKDILSRYAIRNENLLRRLLEFLLDNIGNPFSARSVCRSLNADGQPTTVETVLNYIDKLQAGMILSKAERYDIKGKMILASTEKYYAGDIGLRNIRKMSEQLDTGKLLENAVYLEMLSRGYDVKIGKFDSQEVDFVCYKGRKKVYLQVAWLLTEECVDREFGNLEKIHDNYPKYVLSCDVIDMSRNGIIHLNIIDFLFWRQEL